MIHTTIGFPSGRSSCSKTGGMENIIKSASRTQGTSSDLRRNASLSSEPHIVHQSRPGNSHHLAFDSGTRTRTSIPNISDKTVFATVASSLRMPS